MDEASRRFAAHQLLIDTQRTLKHKKTTLSKLIACLRLDIHSLAYE
ncbi:hypothetical protein PS870_05432 [Pseudomonas fluorescens]|jgi:hypothetical protein|uniref:Uncharacterized protein n=1 Tax=Pseudomonas fluorescens TaxID=294 RepID=A0A5E7PTQ0_PSEFL|nr:hypothetical protein PS870_05432 [Pseudomonas fluorescens]